MIPEALQLLLTKAKALFSRVATGLTDRNQPAHHIVIGQWDLVLFSRQDTGNMDSNGDIGLGITQSMHGGCLVLGHDYWIKGLTTIRKSYIGFCVSSEFFIDQ